MLVVTCSFNTISIARRVHQRRDDNHSPASAVDLRLRKLANLLGGVGFANGGQSTNFVPIQIQRIWQQFSAFQLAERTSACKIWRAYAAPVTNQDENG